MARRSWYSGLWARAGTRDAAAAFLVWAFCTAVVFWALQARGPLLADVDSLYHYQVASLIRESPPWVDITWLPFTVLGARGPDHHWLFHLLVAPLTALGHDARSLDLASAIVAGAVPAALTPMLRRAAVPFAALLALLALFASDALPFRFAGLRAQALALVFMVATLFAMARRRHIAIAVIAFLFTESYHGAVILGLFAVVSLAAQWICERRFDLRIVTAAALGVFAGLLLSPWFPRNISYLVFHTVFKTGSSDPFLVGTEWLRPPISLLVGGSIVAHAVLASAMAVAALLRARGVAVRPRSDTVAAWVVTAIFLAMNATAWRFVEYYAPFAIVSAGLLLRDAFAAAPAAGTLRRASAAGLVACLAWSVPHGAHVLAIAPGERFDAFADFMRYVDANDPAPMVFNTRWSDFQHMVFWSRRARYAAGLDGNYLRYGDPRRFALWHAFATGERLGRHDNAAAIRDAFGAGWIVVSSTQPELADNLAQDDGAELAMARPGSGWLFRIRGAGDAQRR